MSCKIFAKFLFLARKLHFSAILARYVQDLMEDLASLARNILARFIKTSHCTRSLKEKLDELKFH